MQGLNSHVSLVAKHNDKWLLMLFSAQVISDDLFYLYLTFVENSCVCLIHDTFVMASMDGLRNSF